MPSNYGPNESVVNIEHIKAHSSNRWIRECNGGAYGVLYLRRNTNNADLSQFRNVISYLKENSSSPIFIDSTINSFF